MLTLIAAGRLYVSDPTDRTRRLYINFARPPGWWKPDASNSMDADWVASKYKTTVAILEEKGFVVSDRRIYPGNWKAWNKPAAVKLLKTPPTLHPTTPPPWWKPGADGTMEVGAAEIASGVTRIALEEAGMIVGATFVMPAPEWEWGDERGLATAPGKPEEHE